MVEFIANLPTIRRDKFTRVGGMCFREGRRIYHGEGRYKEVSEHANPDIEKLRKKLKKQKLTFTEDRTDEHVIFRVGTKLSLSDLDKCAK